MYKFLEKPATLLWNNDFHVAEKQLESYKNSIPRVALIYSQCCVLKASMSGKVETKKEALGRLKEASKVCKHAKLEDVSKLMVQLNREALEKNEPKGTPEQDTIGLGDTLEGEPLQIKDAPPVITDFEEMKRQMHWEMKSMRGTIILWIGLQELQNANYIKGSFHLRKAWGILYGVYKDIKDDKTVHPEVRDNINASVGTFFFMLSILPSVVTKLLEVIGFVADREEGVAMLYDVVRANSGVSPAAAMLLSVNYLFIPRALTKVDTLLAEYKPILQFYLNEYPNSAFFRLLASHYVRKVGAIELATQHLEKGIQICEENNIEQNIFNFELAQSYFTNMEYQKAHDKLLTLVQKDEKIEMKTLAAILLCVCLIKLDRESEVDALFDSIPKQAIKKSRIDKLTMSMYNSMKKIAGKSKEVRNQLLLLSGYQTSFLRREIAHMNSEAAERMLKTFSEDTEGLIEKTNHPDVFTSVKVIRSQLLLMSGRKEECRKELLEVVNYPHIKKVKQCEWLVSAYYELCEDEYFNYNNKEKALEYVTKAMKYKGYPMEEVVRSRCQLAKKQLTQELKEEKR